MKIELRIGSALLAIESASPVSLTLWDDAPAPAAAPVPASPHAPATLHDDGLFSRLAELRKELAAGQNVPPYVIFHDKTLREMADTLPQDMAALANISGVGQAKLEKYGPAFLALINGAV